MSTPSLELPKSKVRVVSDALNALCDRQVIDAETRDRIASHLTPMPFDWRRLARYSFLASIACALLGLGAVFADAALLALLEKLFHLSWALKSLAFAVLSGLILALGVSRRARRPEKIFSNETIFFAGVLGIAAAVACLGKAIDTGSGHYSVLILLAALIYGVLGVRFESKLIWTFCLLSLGGWFGAETGYVSGWGAYYLGMAYPLRFVLFGSALTLTCLLLPTRPHFAQLFGVTRVMGLLYLFIALWILSIWGNYDGYASWHQASHWELFHWSLYFGLAAAGAIYLGLKNDDNVLRGFGLTFLAINLYTKFFEFFWDDLHKAVFFALLGASFWLLGSRAETIWQMKKLRERIHS